MIIGHNLLSILQILLLLGHQGHWKGGGAGGQSPDPSVFTAPCLLIHFVFYDLSFASTETKFKNPITKAQNNFLVNTGFLVKLFQKKPKW